MENGSANSARRGQGGTREEDRQVIESREGEVDRESRGQSELIR